MGSKKKKKKKGDKPHGKERRIDWQHGLGELQGEGVLKGAKVESKDEIQAFF